MYRNSLRVLWAVAVSALLLTACAQKRGTDLNAALNEQESPPASGQQGQKPATVASAGPARSGPSQGSAKPAEGKVEAGKQAEGKSGEAKAAEAKPAEKTEAQKQEEAEKKVKEAEQRKIQRAKLERDLAIARERLTQTKMAMEHGQVNNDLSLAKAKAEFEIATTKFNTYKDQSLPTRIARAELELQFGKDNVKEAEEELAQLEMMYKEDEFADKTKEIVLERGKRRLERARRDLELRQTDFKTMKEKTLPVEMNEQEWQVRDKDRALAQAQRDAQASSLEKHIGIMGAEAEIIRIETEIDTVNKEEEKARKEAETAAAKAESEKK